MIPVLDPARTAQHRYAALLEGGIIDIFDFKPGSRVVCIECRRPMVARQGKRKLWHFAHKADNDHSCSPETVLHRLAKTFIYEGFTSARRQQHSYPLCWPCSRCGKETSVDCMECFENVEVEGAPIPGVRSDVFLRGRTSCAVEVVVTHDLEEETASLYAAAGVPVFIVRPTWDTIGDLRGEIRAQALRFARTASCAGCRELDELAATQNMKEIILRLHAGLDRGHRTGAPRNAARWSMIKDQRGKELDAVTRESIQSHVANLFKLGFRPTGRRGILVKNIHEIGPLRAHFQGTREIPLTADPRPKLYLELHIALFGEPARMLLCEELETFLRTHNVSFGAVWVSPENRIFRSAGARAS